MSITPQVSLIECIPSMGAPMSTVFKPAFAAIIGPMVDPHAASFLTMKSWMGTSPDIFAIYRTKLAPTVSVIYLWFALVLITSPF